MKNVILLLTVLLAFIDGHAQVNYHFCEQPGTLAAPGTFNGYPGNWQRSHGSPTWLFSSTPSISEVFMWHKLSSNLGEGIYQDNVFPEPGSYKVRVGIKAASYTGKIRVLAAIGLVPDPGSSTTPPASAGPIPPVPAADTQLIGEWTTAYSGASTLDWVVNTSFYNSFENAQIWIYPEQTTNTNGQFDCVIDYVTVCRVPQNGITYNSGTLPSGSPYRFFFNIGSSFPAGSGIVINNVAKNTEYTAKQFIDIAPNTYIEPGVYNKYFLAQIKQAYPCIEPEIRCGQPNSKFSITQGDSVDNGRNIELGKFDELITLYPNPNDGTFDITLPNTDSYDIAISNVVGSVIYQTKVSGAIKHSIRMQDAAPGNYFVTISNRQFKEVKRMVLTER